jgi:hypothetical protein
MIHIGIAAGVSPDSQSAIDEVVNDVHYRWTDHFESHIGLEPGPEPFCRAPHPKGTVFLFSGKGTGLSLTCA